MMAQLVEIHAVYERGAGTFEADVSLDFGGGTERVRYGVAPNDTAPINLAILAAIATGAVTPQSAPVAVPPVPMEVTNFQARAVLLNMPGTVGATMLDDITMALQAVGGQAWQAWEYANTISRGGVLVSQMAAQFGFSEEQLDDMFRQAAVIEA